MVPHGTTLVPTVQHTCEIKAMAQRCVPYFLKSTRTRSNVVIFLRKRQLWQKMSSSSLSSLSTIVHHHHARSSSRKTQHRAIRAITMSSSSSSSCCSSSSYSFRQSLEDGYDDDNNNEEENVGKETTVNAQRLATDGTKSLHRKRSCLLYTSDAADE